MYVGSCFVKINIFESRRSKLMFITELYYFNFNYNTNRYDNIEKPCMKFNL